MVEFEKDSGGGILDLRERSTNGTKRKTRVLAGSMGKRFRLDWVLLKDDSIRLTFRI